MAAKNYNWCEIAQHPKYLQLKSKKRRFLFGWWIASSIYYFLLPVLQLRLPVHPVPVRRRVLRGDLLHTGSQQ